MRINKVVYYCHSVLVYEYTPQVLGMFSGIPSEGEFVTIKEGLYRVESRVFNIDEETVYINLAWY